MHTFRIALGITLVLLLAGCNEVSQKPQQTASDTKTYVIVHGAWGGGWAFREVDEMLTNSGHKVFRPTAKGRRAFRRWFNVTPSAFRRQVEG